MKKFLTICTGNSFRSQMAEGFIREFAKGCAEVYSSGVKANGKVSPWAIKLMQEEGIDISNHTSEMVDIYLDRGIDVALTVCDNANAVCPAFVSEGTKRIHQSFQDAEKQGDMSDEDYLASLRPIRDAIKAYCKELVEKELN